MRVDVTLPRLVGTRRSADELFEAAVASNHDVEALVLRARAVLNAAPSFVDELIKRTGENGIGEIHLIGESAELRSQFIEAAARRGGTVNVTSASVALV